MRIAIIGAGISGLTCAHLLHREHDISVYEASNQPGGHANTVEVETASGTYAVDTGFIVFNDRNYPRFERLLAEIEVATQSSDMSFGISDGRGFEYNGASPNGLFACRHHLASPVFHRMVADLLRFNRDARTLLASNSNPSLGEWLGAQNYSQAFVERLIVPQVSAVWSAQADARWAFPARFLAAFFDNHGMLGFRNRPRWRTVTGGSRTYVDALVRPWRSSLRLATPVRQVRRDPAGVTVLTRAGTERFDAVVMAAHSDQALALLADPTDRERELLGAIPYQRNEAVLHTDRRLLPRRRRAWASWNYHLHRAAAGPATVTYHMNRLQSLDADVELLVSLNRTDEINSTKVIRKFEYAHPAFTLQGVRAQNRHAEISCHHRTHYCGAYWGWGFHEDGVRSAFRVAQEINAGARELIAA
jgi:predicted NAD/FAD-binding protein